LRTQNFIPILILAVFLCACGQNPPAGGVKHYHLTGKVVSINPKDQTATVAAAAIPNFMDAMTMEYPVKSKSDFAVLRVGESIEATVNVADAGGYDLSEIKAQPSGK
jgi:Cu/Ag efflux protein CusF